MKHLLIAMIMLSGSKDVDNEKCLGPATANHCLRSAGSDRQ